MADDTSQVEPGTDGPLFGDRNPLLGYIRIGLSFAVAFTVLFLAQPTPLLFCLGLPLILAGEWFHAWGHGHLVKNLELINSGPYAHTQNPLYFGRILLVAGFLITARLPGGLNWIILIVACALFFGYYMPRKTRREGRRLKAFHGEAWVEYNKAVPVLFPTLTPYPGSGGKPFSLWHSVVTNREWIMLLCIGFGVAVLYVKAF
jgi:protein-S-isoprenylcysteine O-methyltransferase Ste14